MQSKNAKQMSDKQRAAGQKILALVRGAIDLASDGDAELSWRLRRYVYIRMMYEERGNPAQRKKLKIAKIEAQKGKCAMCGKLLPKIGAELDRIDQLAGYTPDNTRLLCHWCHRKDQERLAFK